MTQGQGLHLWPGAIPPSLVQLGMAAIPSRLGLGPETGRLTVVPFLLMPAVFSGLICRNLGVGAYWAGIAGILVATSPLELSVATGLMSDVGYIGLLMAAAYCAVCSLRDGRLLPWCIGFTALRCSSARVRSGYRSRSSLWA